MITISNISKDFTLNGVPMPVLKDINIEVQPREVLVLLGMSGCGKSTILKAVAGLISTDSGKILLDGKPVTSPNSEIGIVFQNYTVFPWMTVLKNIELGLSHSHIKNEERNARATTFLNLVGLSGFANAWPSTLSGGMLQRVAIARTYAMNPKVLLMDEPFGALDALTRRTMQKEFLHIHATEKKSTIFVTHDVDEAITVGDRIVVLSPRPARIVAEFKNPKYDSHSEVDEISKISLKCKINTIFKTFNDISLILSGVTPDIPDDTNNVEYIDAFRNQIIKDNNLAESIWKNLNSWDYMTALQKQYILNLLPWAVRNNDSYRKKLFDFAMNRFKVEGVMRLKVQLIFTAFHAGGDVSDECEDKLATMIDWIGSHIQEFDSVCKGYYGKNYEESIKTLVNRLDNPLYKGSLPLYLLNLRSFSEYNDNLKSFVGKYKHNERKSIMKTIELFNRFFTLS